MSASLGENAYRIELFAADDAEVTGNCLWQIGAAEIQNGKILEVTCTQQFRT
jgi:hypothetical protein